VLADNRREGIAVHDPASDGERAATAEECAVRLRTRIPVLVDGVDDAVASATAAGPTGCT
jgi:hypothetical protein